MKHFLVLALAFMVLAGIILLLFIAGKTQEHPQQSVPPIAGESQSTYESSQSSVPNSMSLLAATAHSRSAIAVLDNDLDHDGNYDGITDPLAALGLLFTMLSIGFVLRPLVANRLPLALYEPPKLSSICPLVLERPG